MEHGISIVNPWMILPFALLLLAIATILFPLFILVWLIFFNS